MCRQTALRCLPKRSAIEQTLSLFAFAVLTASTSSGTRRSARLLEGLKALLSLRHSVVGADQPRLIPHGFQPLEPKQFVRLQPCQGHQLLALGLFRRFFGRLLAFLA